MTGRNQCTPLHLASFYGHSDVVKELLSKNASKSAIQRHGSTPLHFACKNGHIEIVKQLLGSGSKRDAQYKSKSGVNFDAKDHNGWTPLHFACLGGHFEIFSELLKKKANTKEKQNFGQKLI